MQGIYKITNKVNNKVYIGQSYDIEKRWKGHLYDLEHRVHHSEHLQKSYNKYGIESFVFEILEEVNDSNCLTTKEQYWIDYYNSMDKNFGYNMKGAGPKGKLSQESKNKLSRKIKEYYKCNDNPMLGKKHSIESKLKISKHRKGIPVTDEQKEKLSKALKNRKFSKEHKEKLSLSKKGEKNPMYGKEGYWKNKNISEETKLKISNSHKGKLMDEKTKIALELSRKKRIESGEYFNEETRKRLSEINKRPKTEEHKLNESKSQKRRLYIKYLNSGKTPITITLINDFLTDYENQKNVKKLIEKYNISKTYAYKIINKEDMSLYLELNRGE